MALPAPRLETCRLICQLKSDLAQELRPLQKKTENVQLSSLVFSQKHNLPILTGRGNNMTPFSSGGGFWQFTSKAGNLWADIHSGADPLGNPLLFWQHLEEKQQQCNKSGGLQNSVYSYLGLQPSLLSNDKCILIAWGHCRAKLKLFWFPFFNVFGFLLYLMLNFLPSLGCLFLGSFPNPWNAEL